MDWNLVNCVFWGTYQLSMATRSHISLTCLWVWAYIVIIVAEQGFILHYDTFQVPCDTCNNLSFAGKRPVWIKSPRTQIQNLRKCQVFSQQVTYHVQHINLPNKLLHMSREECDFSQHLSLPFFQRAVSLIVHTYIYTTIQACIISCLATLLAIKIIASSPGLPTI